MTLVSIIAVMAAVPSWLIIASTSHFPLTQYNSNRNSSGYDVGAICALLCFWVYLLCTHTLAPANCYYFSVNFCILQKCYNPRTAPNEQTYRSNAVLINAKAVATIFNVTFEHVCGGNGNKERFHLMAMAMAIALAISV